MEWEAWRWRTAAHAPRSSNSLHCSPGRSSTARRRGPVSSHHAKSKMEAGTPGVHSQVKEAVTTSLTNPVHDQSQQPSINLTRRTPHAAKKSHG
eukprot:268041-Pleurochrysis_carterae.AAC.3